MPSPAAFGTPAVFKKYDTTNKYDSRQKTGTSSSGEVVQAYQIQAAEYHVPSAGGVISVPDNVADAFEIAQSTNKYITICTTDSAEKVTIGQHMTLATDKNLTMAGSGTLTVGTAGITATSGSALTLGSTTVAPKMVSVTTAQRDALTAANGMIVYNSTTGQFEGYDSSWAALGGGGAVPGTDNLSWTINQDFGVTDEDPSLVLGGGDGTNKTKASFVTDSSADLVSFYFEQDTAGNGTYATAAPTLQIGKIGETASKTPTLQLSGGTGAANKTATIAMSAGADLVITGPASGAISAATNFDAEAGLDVTGGELSIGTGGSYSQTVGAFTYNVSGSNYAITSSQFTVTAGSTVAIGATAANVTLSTTTSGTLAITSAGALNMTYKSNSQVSGTAAASGSAGGTFVWASPAGGVSASSTAGGTGGTWQVSAGTGGAATDASGASAGAGGTLTLFGGTGGAGIDGTNDFAGGAGGAAAIYGGTGGAGHTAQNPGAGGAMTVTGGSAGAIGSSGGANGGALYLRGGAKTGSGTNGTAYLGDANTAALSLGNATDNTTITQVGSGQVTFVGNVDATGGLDVTGAALSIGASGSYSQTAGAFTYNVSASNYAITASAINLTSNAASTWTMTGGAVNFKLKDNTANAFVLENAGGDDFLAITTTDSAETVNFGNATSNPSFSFLGTGAVSIGGNLAVTGTVTVSGSRIEIDSTVQLYKDNLLVVSSEPSAAVDGGVLVERYYTTWGSADATGTAQAGASTTITLAAGASGTNDAYLNWSIAISSGTGAGQQRLITAYNGTSKVATVDRAWDTTPDNTSVYALHTTPDRYVGVLWDESADEFVVGKTHKDPGASDITFEGYLALRCAGLVATAASSVAGGLTLTTSGITMTGLDIGSTSAEIGNIYQADDKYTFFGTSQSAKIGYASGFAAVTYVGATAGLLVCGSDAGTGISLSADSAALTAIAKAASATGTGVSAIMAQLSNVDGTALTSGVCSALTVELEGHASDGSSANYYGVTFAPTTANGGSAGYTAARFQGGYSVGLKFEAAYSTASIAIPDNSATAFTIKEGSNSYLTLVTTNASEAITLHKATTVTGAFAISTGGSYSQTVGGFTYNVSGGAFSVDAGAITIAGTDATLSAGSAAGDELVLGKEFLSASTASGTNTAIAAGDIVCIVPAASTHANDVDGVYLAINSSAARAFVFGIAVAGIAVAETDIVADSGIVKVNKVGSEQWNNGDRVYVSGTAGKGTKDTAGFGSGTFECLVGICCEDEDSASTTARLVKLVHEPLVAIP